MPLGGKREKDSAGKCDGTQTDSRLSCLLFLASAEDAPETASSVRWHSCFHLRGDVHGDEFYCERVEEDKAAEVKVTEVREHKEEEEEELWQN